MIRSFGGVTPQIARSAYVDETAQIIGDVVIGEHASIWPNVVIRGDVNYIRIGSHTNVQDNSVLHVETDRYPLLVGDRVTVGHSVVLHGCHIESHCLIGIGAVVLNGVQIGEGSIVGAGSVVLEHAVIPPGSLVLGVPGKLHRQVTQEEIERMERTIAAYIRLKDHYLAERQTRT